MSEWVPLNVEQLSKWQSPEGTTEVMSPYDVPEAVRGYYDQKAHQCIIEFRYIGDEPWKRERGNNQVILRLGRHSGRLYGIEADVQGMGSAATQVVQVPLENVQAVCATVTQVVHAFAAQQPLSHRRENYDVVTTVIAQHAAELFENPKVKVHPQSDGGAILEAIITDSQGRTSKQELQVSMSNRQRFGDDFLIKSFKADIQAGSTPRFRFKQLQRLEIETTDPLFHKDLEEMHIERLRIALRMHASADIDTAQKTLLNIEFDGADAAILFGQWLYDRLSKTAPYKTTLNGVDVSNNADQIRAIIKSYIQNRYGITTEQ